MKIGPSVNPFYISSLPTVFIDEVLLYNIYVVLTVNIRFKSQKNVNRVKMRTFESNK